MYLGGPGVTTSAYGYALAPGGVISVALLSVDAHVEFDRIGSRDEYVQ